jgi:hypothetical protein
LALSREATLVQYRSWRQLGCGVAGCSNLRYVRGRCQRHDAQLRRGEEPTPLPARTERHCAFLGCTRRGSSKGYCVAHSRQSQRRQMLTAIREYAQPTNQKSCAVTDCGRPRQARGLCKSHYNQQNRGESLRTLGPATNLGERKLVAGLCTEPGCDRQREVRARCRSHHARARYLLRRKVRTCPVRSTERPGCSELNCVRPACLRGQCRTHYRAANAAYYQALRS